MWIMTTAPNTKIQQLDVVYIVDGLNAGRYTIEFLEFPMRSASDQYRKQSEKADQTVKALKKIMDGSIS